MILRSLKIASQSGHRWAGLFRRLSAKFAHFWRNSPKSKRAKVEVYEGFIIKHSLIGGRVTTRVVDPSGYLLGVVDPVSEGFFTNPVNQDYLWPAYPRDVFAPGIPIPDDLVPQPFDPASLIIRATTAIYGGYPVVFGTAWPGGETWFTAGSPTDDYGIGTTAVRTNTASPASGANYATIFTTTELAASMRFYTAKRGAAGPLPYNLVQIVWYESGLATLMPGFFLAPRMYPLTTSTAAGGSGLPLSVRMPRQIPLPSCVRDRGRLVGLFSVSGSPTRTTFDYACGETGLVLTFFTVVSQELIEVGFRQPTASTMLAPAALAEAWDDEKPWIQEFETTESVTWFNPDAGTNEEIEVEVDHKVIYPVGGTYLKAEIPFDAFMPNHLGAPIAVMFDDRVEVYSDFRFTRTWVDERGDDIYPDLTPLTMQTQTGIFRTTVPYTVDEEEETFNVGPMSNTIEVLDISGAEENSYQMGGDRLDFHRLYRVRWAGNVGGRAVVIASVIKHKRWETAPANPIPEGGPVIPNLAAAVMRQTAQSGINSGHTVRWEWTYQTPSGQTVNGLKTWPLGTTAKIPGDDGDGGQWQDAVGVVMLVDGVITEWDAKSLGWCLLRTATAQTVREDDWRWESATQKWAVAISDTEIVLCAYDFPYTPGVTTCKLLKINVLTGVVTLLRTDTLPSANARPAITCYQRRIDDGDKTMESCLIYRLGSQTAAGWIELSKDGGDTWHRIWNASASPGMGAFYIGSAIWTPESGNVFQPYM